MQVVEFTLPTRTEAPGAGFTKFSINRINKLHVDCASPRLWSVFSRKVLTLVSSYLPSNMEHDQHSRTRAFVGGLIEVFLMACVRGKLSQPLSEGGTLLLMELFTTLSRDVNIPF